jgi:hypothetical protein
MNLPTDPDDWALMIRPGSPGDVFRFLHGLNTRFSETNNRKCCVICSKDDIENIAVLLAAPGSQEPRRIDGDAGADRWELFQVNNHQWLSLNGLESTSDIERHITEFTDAWRECFDIEFAQGRSPIWTSYSDARNKQRKRRPLESGRIQRIDCAGGCQGFASTTASFPGIAKYEPAAEGKPLRVAVVLRGGRKRGCRDSPDYHRDETFLRDVVARDYDIEFEFFGYPTNDEEKSFWPTWGIRRPYDGLTFRQQVSLAQEFHLAVGVNSSALDVFSIAGVPVVRECEFQGVMKSGWPFRRRYNSFLCGNVNVGLGIRRNSRGNRSWQDRNRFAEHVLLLLERCPWEQNVEWGGSPKHVHVVPGARLEETAAKIEVHL